jgi:hypothetical protein
LVYDIIIVIGDSKKVNDDSPCLELGLKAGRGYNGKFRFLKGLGESEKARGSSEAIRGLERRRVISQEAVGREPKWAEAILANITIDFATAPGRQ